MLRELVATTPVAPMYRGLFELALDLTEGNAQSAPIFPPIDLPVTAAGLSGLPGEIGVLAAALSTLVWSGADLLDDGADGQLGDCWAGNSPHQIALVATNLLSTLPHTLVGKRVGVGREAAAYSQALARTLLTMSEGQWADLGSPATVTNLDEYMAVIRRKTGAEFALFASTPAILAGVGQQTVTGWVRFGMSYGVLLQAFSDAVSTVAEGSRNDLLDGKRSLPVFHCLAVSSGAAQTSLLKDLDMASRGEHAAVARIVERMKETESSRYARERCELFRLQAAEALPARLADLPMGHAARVLLRVYA